MTIEQIIEQLALEHQTTPEYIRNEIESSIMNAQSSTDPVVQAHWSRIPRKGEYVTADEFIPYMAELVTLFK